MVVVTVEGDRASFKVEGWDRLWAFRSHIEIPLEHITDVENPQETAATLRSHLPSPG